MHQWISKCHRCGTEMVMPSAVAKPHQRRHHAKGLCDLCYYGLRRDNPPMPKDFMICSDETCRAPMVSKHSGTFGGKFKRHAGKGLCVACYNREMRARRREAERGTIGSK